MTMEYIYIKLDDIQFGGKRLYYQFPIETRLHRARVFCHQYEYFRNDTESESEPETTLTALGSFRGIGARSIPPDFEIVNDVYMFDEDCVRSDQLDRLYCRGIPESAIHLTAVESLTYIGYPVFVSTR